MELEKVVKNAFYASGVQVATMLFGLIKTFMIPKMLGVIGFGWWQYYLLWVVYVGLFALGFNDGFYLKYGSYDYNDLPKARLNSSFRVFFVVEIIIGFLFAASVFFVPNVEKRLILFAVALNIPLHAIKGFFIYVFQVTNRIKRYSFYSLIDRFTFLVVVALLFVFRITNYWIVIGLDILSLVFVIGLMMYTCRDIFRDRRFSFSEGMAEFKDNVSVGVKLMIAIFTASFAGGIARFFIEHYEGIEVFSCFSFAGSSTNVITMFIGGLATIAYPTLARMDKERYGEYFRQMDRLVSVFAFGALLLYPLLVIAIQLWFSEYGRCLSYYPVIVGGIFVSAKMSLVVNTFYKAMREEKQMLYVNVSMCLLLVAMLFAFYFSFRSELSVAVAIFVAEALVYFYSKIYISKKLNCLNLYDCFLEIIMVTSFIVSCYLRTGVGFLLYLATFCLFFFYNRKAVFGVLAKFKHGA